MKKTAVIFFAVVSLLTNNTAQAQQIYEVPAMGFKFVMDCECNEVYIALHLSNHLYKMNMVPLVTYVAKGSPAEEMHLINQKLFHIGDTSLIDKTPEQIISLFSNASIAGKELWLTNEYNYIHKENFPVIPAFNSVVYIFPSPKFAPVPGGPLLLGTLMPKEKYINELEARLVHYENGDEWYGSVVNKMYPDYSVVGGIYFVHETVMQSHFSKNKIYIDSIAVVRKQFMADSIQYQIDSDIFAAKQKLKLHLDSLINRYSLTQIIDTILIIQSAKYTSSGICGTGIDVNQIDGQWFITVVEKYSPAWLAGLKTGDRLTSVGENDKYIYEMNKLEIIMELTCNINEEVKLTFVRPSQPGNEMSVTMNCLHIYKRNLSLAGAFFAGDTESGKGIYIDEKGNIYIGTITNGKLNGEGKIILPKDSMVITSNFINNVKNGNTTIAVGTARIHVDGNGHLQNSTMIFSSNFSNDKPDGFGTITFNWEASFYVRFENGVLQGKALRIINNNLYFYCDVNSNYTLSNCFQYNGTPTDMSMMPTPVVTLTDLPTTPANSNYSPEPTTNQPTDEGNTLVNLNIALTKIEEADATYTFTSHENWIVQPDANYDLKYVRVSVPPHKTLQINFVMAIDEIEKVKFLPRNMTYLYENRDGGALSGGGQEIGGLFYWQYYTISNNYDKEGDVLIEIRALPSSHHFTRTIVYSSGISN